MSFFQRTKYLAYYLKEMDWEKFNKFKKFVQQKTGKSSFAIWMDAIRCVYKYNIGLIDYFLFKFYEKSPQEREKWVGTGWKYEFDLRMNPKSTRNILENKLEFYGAYGPFINHEFSSIQDVQEGNAAAQAVLNNASGKIVVKDSTGQCGWDVEVLDASKFSLDSLGKYMASKGFDLVESFVQQHPEINKLSPSGLNTVRMITMINNQGGVDILGARMRISVNSHVDNLASGNIACPIDLETGRIAGPGVYSDITKESVTKHPITQVELINYQIPHWQEIVETTKKIALHRPENRGVGWDVAVTANGPDFIEGNHNWCKILWQIPVNQGLKSVLMQYK